MMSTPLSLLERLIDNRDGVAWSQLVKTYAPLIRTYLHRNHVLAGDLDDLVQDVLHTMVKELPRFRHNQQPGAFRAWLRQIAVNRARNYWRAHANAPVTGTQAAGEALAQLEDPASGMHRLWDEEHDRFVVNRLLDLIEPEFEPRTWQAFRRMMQDGEKPADTAAALGISVGLVQTRVTELGQGCGAFGLHNLHSNCASHSPVASYFCAKCCAIRPPPPLPYQLLRCYRNRSSFEPCLSVNAVFIAKSRVLSRLRQESRGLID